jgi:hypothetical protein
MSFDTEILMQESPLVHYADPITPITKSPRLRSAGGRVVILLNASSCSTTRCSDAFYAPGDPGEVDGRRCPRPRVLSQGRGDLHGRPYRRSAPGRRKSTGKEGAQGRGPRKPRALVIFDGSRVFGVPCAEDCRCYTARPSRSSTPE